MKTSDEVKQIATQAIVAYAAACETAGAQDVINAMECLISVAARAAEKYKGNDAALDILIRTAEHVQNKPANYGTLQ